MDVTVHHRHDISDELWAKIEPEFPNSNGKRGRPVGDNRRFFNGVLWIMRSGAPWRDLPPDYGHWNSVFVRFRRLAKAGFWARLAKLFTACPDFEWIMIDASHFKVHQHGMGAPGGTEDARRTKGGINTKLHVAVDAHGMPVRFQKQLGIRLIVPRGLHCWRAFLSSSCWPTRDTTPIPLLGICAAVRQFLLSLPKAIARFKGIMTNISISYAILLKIIFKKSNHGEVLQHAM